MTRPDIEQRLHDRAGLGGEVYPGSAWHPASEDVALLTEAAEEIRRLREFYAAYVELDEASKDYEARLDAWKAGNGRYPSFAGISRGLCRLKAARATLHPTEPHE